MNADLMTSTIYEHRFWLQVLGDHARFFYIALRGSEREEITRTNYFIQEFDSLLAQARQGLSRESLPGFQELIWQRVRQLKEFKFHLIRRQIEGMIGFNLSSSLVSHMVNELEEYQLILGFLLKGEKVPLFPPTHYHLLWLLDAVGHADAIMTSLDSVEKPWRKQSQGFTDSFEHFYQKALEMAGFQRALQNFPALAQFNQEAAGRIIEFIQFLTNVQQTLLHKTLLGTLDLLMPDHMLREECYYLIKLSSVSDVQAPSCDPGKPRISEKL